MKNSVRGFPPVVETARLLIRPNDPATAEVVNAAVRASFKELHEWMPWAERLPPVEITRKHLTESQEQYHAGTDCGLGLWLKDSGAFVGASGLHPRPADPMWREIGYWVHTAHAGRGLATEAVLGIVETGFALGLAGIELKASERNVASHRVAERAGFVREAILDDGRLDPGGHPSRTVLFVRRNAT